MDDGQRPALQKGIEGALVGPDRVAAKIVRGVERKHAACP